MKGSRRKSNQSVKQEGINLKNRPIFHSKETPTVFLLLFFINVAQQQQRGGLLASAMSCMMMGHVPIT